MDEKDFNKTDGKYFLKKFLLPISYICSNISVGQLLRKLKENVWISKFVEYPMIRYIFNFIKHPVVAAIIAGLVVFWLTQKQCDEVPLENCWKVEGDVVYIYYKEIFSDPTYDKWYACHIMAECFSDPKQLSRFLNENSIINSDTKSYINKLNSDKQDICRWNAVAIFQARYWKLVKQHNVITTTSIADGGNFRYLRLPLTKIKSEIFNKLNKQFLNSKIADLLIDFAEVKIDPFIVGDSTKFSKYVKNAINDILPPYIYNSGIEYNKNIKYHISMNVKELNDETALIPQLEFYVYKDEKIYSYFSVPIPIVRDLSSQRDFYIQNAFRALIGTLLCENNL